MEEAKTLDGDTEGVVIRMAEAVNAKNLVRIRMMEYIMRLEAEEKDK